MEKEKSLNLGIFKEIILIQFLIFLIIAHIFYIRVLENIPLLLLGIVLAIGIVYFGLRILKSRIKILFLLNLLFLILFISSIWTFDSFTRGDAYRKFIAQLIPGILLLIPGILLFVFPVIGATLFVLRRLESFKISTYFWTVFLAIILTFLMGFISFWIYAFFSPDI